MNNEEPAVNGIKFGSFVQVLLAMILVSAVLYFARAVFEPIAFALFGMALVWPFQKALEAGTSKSIALTLHNFIGTFCDLRACSHYGLRLATLFIGHSPT